MVTTPSPRRRRPCLYLYRRGSFGGPHGPLNVVIHVSIFSMLEWRRRGALQDRDDESCLMPKPKP